MLLLTISNISRNKIDDCIIPSLKNNNFYALTSNHSRSSNKNM